MNEFLTIENVTVVGCMMIAIIWLVKDNAKKATAESKAVLDKVDYINQNNLEDKERHKKELTELKEEIKVMHNERKEERKEWLNALCDNTEQLKNVANKLAIIPNMQKDIDSMKEDIEVIKNKIK